VIAGNPSLLQFYAFKKINCNKEAMEKTASIVNIPVNDRAGSSQRILFASVPADGHFNPLTGLAIHLQNIGYDVRWYTSIAYADRLRKLKIQHYPFQKALDKLSGNSPEIFTKRGKLKGKISKLCFDLVHGFILRGPEYFEDITAIQRDFPFDIVISDCAFTGIPFIKEKLKVPVIAIGVLPLIETSKDLYPVGLGLTPSNTFWGRKKQGFLRYVADKILFRNPNRLIASLLKKHDLPAVGSNIFDACVRSSALFLQSGTPGFEYKRSDLGSNIRFIGPLLPVDSRQRMDAWYYKKLVQYRKVILVTQGTVEKDITKLLMPTLEAFKNSDYLVVATTGGSGTNELKEKYVYDNIIIEDFIPFADIMPYVSVYITNGGYGGVMLSIKHEVPMVVAGVHEGKNEINARVGYFKLGINLRTEKPSTVQLKKSVEKVLGDKIYRYNVKKLSQEFSRYNPNELCASYIKKVLNEQGSIKEFTEILEAITRRREIL
jgi:MGT family glycosyltransferase